METTLVVSVTLKVDAKGSTPDELISNALTRALDFADNAAEQAQGVSVEGGSVLVNRAALVKGWS